MILFGKVNYLQLLLYASVVFTQNIEDWLGTSPENRTLIERLKDAGSNR